MKTDIKIGRMKSEQEEKKTKKREKNRINE